MESKNRPRRSRSSLKSSKISVFLHNLQSLIGHGLTSLISRPSALVAFSMTPAPKPMSQSLKVLRKCLIASSKSITTSLLTYIDDISFSIIPANDGSF